MKIAIIGAIDRYNYGDVLFPLIAVDCLGHRLNDVSFDFYGAIESDLSCYSAKITKKMSDLYVDKPDVIIVVGGETLIASWTATYINTSTNWFLINSVRLARKMIGHSLIEFIIRKKMGANNSLPWSFQKKDYNVNKIIYNTVGGVNFDRLTKKEKQYLLANLNDASYVSVRDRNTFDNIISLGVDKKGITISPDSAFIMSQVFPIDLLKNMTNSNFNSKLPDKYVAFQIGINYIRGNEALISKQLKSVIENTGMPIVLVPIGRVPMHEDDLALNMLKSTFKNIFGDDDGLIYLDSPGIFETMYAIATAELFVGTSLHGNITALSFGKPTLPIGNVEKVDKFLDLFSIANQITNVDYDDIAVAVDKSLCIDRSVLLNNSKKIIDLVNNNFDKIAEVIRK